MYRQQECGLVGCCVYHGISCKSPATNIVKCWCFLFCISAPNWWLGSHVKSILCYKDKRYREYPQPS